MAGVKLSNRIRELREAKLLSQEQLARLCIPPTTQAQIDRLEKGLRKMTQAWMLRISPPLGVEPGDLFPNRSAQKPPATDTREVVAPHNQGRVTVLEGAQDLLTRKRDVPILGHVKAGKEGFFLDQGEAHGMARRPPILEGVKNAFAVYVHDDSMFPAYEPGWVVYVHPTRPPAPPCNVVIEMQDGQSFIKRLIRRTEKQIICKQWSPEGEMRFDRAKVRHVYVVVGHQLEP